MEQFRAHGIDLSGGSFPYSIGVAILASTNRLSRRKSVDNLEVSIDDRELAFSSSTAPACLEPLDCFLLPVICGKSFHGDLYLC